MPRIADHGQRLAVYLAQTLHNHVHNGHGKYSYIQPSLNRLTTDVIQALVGPCRYLPAISPPANANNQ